ncbi:prolipoprotein diacylglyceryl transferase family protein, partial [Kribbella sp.]|uniref:prolipoprotein diacylglyceryl transferase family protein n=1 Tax=Kribbella sp. TaxID=1871183 RepID=UPI002D68E3BE
LGHGRAFFLYAAAYTAGRAWIENLRIDTVNHIFGLRLNVWTALIMFVLAVLAFIISARKRPGQESIASGPAAGKPADGVAGDAADGVAGDAADDAAGGTGAGGAQDAAAAGAAGDRGTGAGGAAGQAAAGGGSGASGAASAEPAGGPAAEAETPGPTHHSGPRLK